MPPRITQLAAEHIRGLAECHITCWREAYQDLAPAQVLAAFDLDQRARIWERIHRHGPEIVYIALDTDDTVIGFSSVGPARDESAPTPLELHALYVRSRYYGSGLADRLIDTAIGPTGPCSLWVFEQNPRARAFYCRHGFHADGANKTEPWTAATEIRMVR